MYYGFLLELVVAYFLIQQWNKLNISVVDTKNVAVKISYLLIWVVVDV